MRILGNNIAAVLEKQGRILLDGFPRTLVQLEFLEKCLAKFNTKLSGVFFLDVDKETLIERLEGRRSCPDCGAVYHVKNVPSRVEGICNVCGGKLYQRKDDNRESIEGRLETYLRQTEPVRKAFEERGLLTRIDASQPREVVYNIIAGKLRDQAAPAGK